MGTRYTRYDLSRKSNALLWAGASTAVLILHLGAVFWMLHEAPVAAAETAPPAAIMLEFSAESEAVLTEENHVAPDMTSSPEQVAVKPQDTPVEPENTPEPQPEPEPVAEPVEEPLPEPPPVQEKAEAVLPAPPPPKPVPKETEKRPLKPEPRRKPPQEAAKPSQRQPAPASQAAAPASAQVKPSNRNAASQSASGAASPSVSPAQWQSRLMAHLERRKRFPAGAAGKTGIAHVRFTMDANGRVLSASLARPSGVPAFDTEVVALVYRASPLPAPPAGASRTIVAPVKFGRGR